MLIVNGNEEGGVIDRFQKAMEELYSDPDYFKTRTAEQIEADASAILYRILASTKSDNVYYFGPDTDTLPTADTQQTDTD